MSLNLISPIYHGMTNYPTERCGFLRGATHFFNFGQKAYQVEYLDENSNALLMESGQHKPTWIGIALRVVALFSLIVPLLMFIATAIYRSLNHFKLISEAYLESLRHFGVDALLDRRSSSNLERVAVDMILIDRLNRGDISPENLRIGTLNSLIDFFGDRAKSITRIDLAMSDDLNQADLNGLRHFPDLTHLDLERCRQIGDISFLKHCPNLRRLYLKGCKKIRDGRVLQHCPDLTFLDLQECRKINDWSFLQYCPKLTDLYLAGCRQVDDESVLRYCPNLTTFYRPDYSWFLLDGSDIYL